MYVDTTSIKFHITSIQNTYNAINQYFFVAWYACGSWRAFDAPRLLALAAECPQYNE